MTLTFSTAVKILVSISAVAFLLGLLFFYLTTPPESDRRVNADLEDFFKGFTFNQRMRLKVSDVQVGGESVVQLFQPSEAEPPNMVELLLRKENPKTLITKPGAIKELRKKLSPLQPRQVVVLLEDDADNWLMRWWLGDAYEEWKTTRVYINVKQLTCSEVYILVYNKIFEKVTESTQTKEAAKEVDLDKLFNLLLEDNIDRYLNTLDEAEEGGECAKTINLLKWIKGENIEGFESGGYRIVEPTQSALDLALEVLRQMRKGQSRSDLDVHIIGYTDARPVMDEASRRLTLRGDEQVFYRGCSEDSEQHTTATSTERSYVSLSSPNGTPVRGRVRDNCELGAARAYAAAVYMSKRLGRDAARYNYATGGISPDAVTAGMTDLPKARKISIKFVLNAMSDGR